MSGELKYLALGEQSAPEHLQSPPLLGDILFHIIDFQDLYNVYTSKINTDPSIPEAEAGGLQPWSQIYIMRLFQKQMTK